MEGTNGYARPLDQLVKDRGYSLLNVNNLKLARFKEIFSSPAKTDSIDAQQIVTLMMMAPFMEQVKESLQPVLAVSMIEQQLKRLSRRRRQLVQEKVNVQNRMQADLQSVCPDFSTSFISGFALCIALSQLSDRPTPASETEDSHHSKHSRHRCGKSSYVGTVAIKGHLWGGNCLGGTDDCRRRKRLLQLKESIDTLEAQLEDLVKQSSVATLLDSIPGFGTISAAEVSGEIGTMTRFASEASLAIYLGMAPLDNSSGKHKGTKSPQQVNKRAKAAMMVGMGHHIRKVAESKAYYEKKRAEGKKHNQALRSLGRHITRVFWNMVKSNRLYEEKKQSPAT